MPRMCSQCFAEIADDSSQCPGCGQPQNTAASRAPKIESSLAEGDRRFPLWQILPWTLLAAALLMMVPLLRHSHSQSASAVQSQSASAVQSQSASAVQSPLATPPVVMPPAAVPPTSRAADNAAASGAGAVKPAQPALPAVASSSAAPASVGAASVPLTVSLYSASRGKHVAVGTPVTISAYVALPPGQSATLAVSYGKGSGPRSLLALTQGSLSSTTWTPFLPGRYLFTASALDSHKNGVFSRPLTIWADAPVPAPAAKSAVPVPSAALPSAPKPRPAAVQIAAARASTAKNAAAVRLSRPKPAAPKRRSAPISTPPAYRVAAAEFPVRRVAFTLAGALRGRGFHASVRPGFGGNHKPSYKVETGDFTQRSDADTQVRLLKQDGYPAFVFQTH